MKRVYKEKMQEIQRLISSSRVSDIEKLRTLAQELFVECRMNQVEEGVAYALYAQGMAYLNQLEIKQALEKLEEARKHAVLARAYETEVRATSGIGLCLMFEQNYEEALEQFLEYMRLYYEYDVGTKLYSALNNVGEIFRLLQKYDTALQYYLEAQEVCDAEDDEFWWVLKTNIANTYIRLEDPDQARRYLKEASAIGTIEEDSHYATIMQQTYGHLAHLEGDFSLAETLLKQALAFYREAPYFAFVMDQNAAYEDLYRVYQSQGKLEKGEALLLEAIAYSKKNAFLPLHIQYLGLLSKHYEQTHETTKSYDTLRKFYKYQMKFEEIRRARKIRNIDLRIELDQLRKEKSDLHTISYIDRLTGINNRRAMQDHFEQFTRGELYPEVKRLGALLFDVDYFKEYNDFYGHLEGDHCLRKIAELLAMIAEELEGQVYRYGGDEFLLVYRKLDADGQRALAEELPKRIADLRIAHEKSYVSDWVSCSMGMMEADREIFESFDQTFLRLDEALYVAKRKGRNCVEIRLIE